MIDAEGERIIRDFPLGIVATVSPDGLPAASPKGTFLVLDENTIAYGDIRSPGTRRNLEANPAVEVVFVDPFRRKGIRVLGRAMILNEDSEAFLGLIPRWFSVWENLAVRISSLVVIGVGRVSPLSTPPYDEGVTEEEMIDLYRHKFAQIYPDPES